MPSAVSRRQEKAARRPTAARKAAARSRRRRCFGGSRGCVYWCFVLCIWGGIAAAGIVVYYGATHAERRRLGRPGPAAQREDRFRRRQACRQSRHDRRRSRRPARNVALHPAGGDRHRGPPLLFAFRRRSDRPGARGAQQSDARPLHPGRLDADAATRQEPVPEARAHAGAQGAGGAAGAVARAQAQQGPDPRNVSEPGLFRLGRLRRRGRVAALLRQVRARRDAGRGRGARRPAQGAVEAVAGARPEGGRRARAAGACRHARGRHDRRQGADDRDERAGRPAPPPTGRARKTMSPTASWRNCPA